MKIVIKNAKATGHTICRATGQKVHIAPNSYIIFDTDEENEIRYWCDINPTILKKFGLIVITDDVEIQELESKSKEDAQKDDASVCTQKDGFYSEQELLSMDKEDLFNICNNFGISYKKNNSVKTLVKMILESVAK